MSAAESKREGQCGVGYVAKAGWGLVDGEAAYRAIVVFPDGPPSDLTFATVWQREPVEIRRVLAETRTRDEGGDRG